MFDIQTVNYTSADAPAAFTKSLRETGFAVLTDHPITPDRIQAAYGAWGGFFNSEEKHDFLVDPETQDGFFPFKSENAKGATAKDLKEFYHVYPEGRVPPSIEGLTRTLYADLVDIGATLLGWIQDNAPDDVRVKLSEPLPNMLAGVENELASDPALSTHAGSARARCSSRRCPWGYQPDYRPFGGVSPRIGSPRIPRATGTRYPAIPA